MGKSSIDGKQAKDYNKGKEGKSIMDVLSRIRAKSPPPPPRPDQSTCDHKWSLRYSKAEDCFSEFCTKCNMVTDVKFF